MSDVKREQHWTRPASGPYGERIFVSLDDLYKYFLAVPLDHLEALPTLGVGQASNRKISGRAMIVGDRCEFDVYLSRCTVADGEPYDNMVGVSVSVEFGPWQERRAPAAGTEDRRFFDLQAAYIDDNYDEVAQ